MKALIKYYLMWGFALSFLALAARRFSEDQEIEAMIDPSGPAPQTPLPQGRAGAPGSAPAPLSGPAHFSRVSDPTVTLNGTLIRNGRHFALRETAGVLYPLDSTGLTWSYLGERVRVTGKIDLGTHMVHVDAIELAMV
jgi:hypothetical protein